MPNFQTKLELAHKGKGNIPVEMIEVEIMKDTGMSLTEQRKQPAWFIELVILDIQTKRRVEAAEIKKAKRKHGR